MNSLNKNLLDLKHSLYLTRASIFFTIGFGGFIAISFGLIQLTKDTLTSLLMSAVWLNIFVLIAIRNFAKCSEIQEEINKYIKHIF